MLAQTRGLWRRHAHSTHHAHTHTQCQWHRNTALGATGKGREGYYFPAFNGVDRDASRVTTNYAQSSTVVNGVGTITVSADFTLVPPTSAGFAAYQTSYPLRVTQARSRRRRLRTRATAAAHGFLRVRTRELGLAGGPRAERWCMMHGSARAAHEQRHNTIACMPAGVHTDGHREVP